MKLGRMVFVGCVVMILALSFGYRQGIAAGEKQIEPSKDAIVDVTKVLQNSKKHKQWQEKMTKEEEQMGYGQQNDATARFAVTQKGKAILDKWFP